MENIKTPAYKLITEDDITDVRIKGKDDYVHVAYITKQQGELLATELPKRFGSHPIQSQYAFDAMTGKTNPRITWNIIKQNLEVNET